MTAEDILQVIAVSMVSDPSYITYLAIASQQCSVKYFGVNYALAVALLAAHMWTLNKVNPGRAGIKTYQANGRLMESFGGLSVITDSISLTNYGLQYKNLVTTSGIAATTSAYDLVISGLLED
jgi:hypothetical protein